MALLLTFSLVLLLVVGALLALALGSARRTVLLVLLLHGGWRA